MQQCILHLHGFASSANSSKARYFGERFRTFSDLRFFALDFNPTPRDFEHLTITGMVNRLRQFILDHHLNTVSIIGSSLGCLVALHYARTYGMVGRLLLLAPLLSYSTLRMSDEKLSEWKQRGVMDVFHYGFNETLPLRYGFQRDALNYSEIIPPPASLHIIHGKRDETIPIENSREYAARYPSAVTLAELESDHSLTDQLTALWEHAQDFLILEKERAVPAP